MRQALFHGLNSFFFFIYLFLSSITDTYHKYGRFFLGFFIFLSPFFSPVCPSLMPPSPFTYSLYRHGGIETLSVGNTHKTTSLSPWLSALHTLSLSLSIPCFLSLSLHPRPLLSLSLSMCFVKAKAGTRSAFLLGPWCHKNQMKIQHVLTTNETSPPHGMKGAEGEKGEREKASSNFVYPTFRFLSIRTWSSWSLSILFRWWVSINAGQIETYLF